MIRIKGLALGLCKSKEPLLLLDFPSQYYSIRAQDYGVISLRWPELFYLKAWAFRLKGSKRHGIATIFTTFIVGLVRGF